MILAASLLAALSGAGVSAPDSAPRLAPTIVHIVLQPESEQRFPIVIPTEPEITVELDFPWPLADWAGRGFTPEPGKYAGDFAVDAARGSRRAFVTPLLAGAHRVLHVILEREPGGTTGVCLEFIPAPPGLSWRKAEFVGYGPPQPPRTDGEIRLSPKAPPSPYREPNEASWGGLIRTMRLLASLPAGLRQGVAAASANLQWSDGKRPVQSLGGLAAGVRFALRDRVTGSLGLCVEVTNLTGSRLVLDRRRWRVLAGSRSYSARTAEFSGELGPRAAQTVFLLLDDDSEGASRRLLPDNDFDVRAEIASDADPAGSDITNTAHD